MGDWNDVTIKRVNNSLRGYRFIVDGVELRHVRDVAIRMASQDRQHVEITLTMLARLVHAVDEHDPSLDNATAGW